MYRKYRAQRYPDKKWIYGYYVHEQGNDVYEKWEKKHGMEPEFSKVINVKRYEIEGGEQK